MVLLLLTLALLALGMFVAAVSPTGKVANALGSILFFPLMFFAGLWIPLPLMPGTLRTGGDFTPRGAGVQALQEAAAGDWPQLGHLAVLAGWIVVMSAAAARFFRWE